MEVRLNNVQTMKHLTLLQKQGFIFARLAYMGDMPEYV